MQALSPQQFFRKNVVGIFYIRKQTSPVPGRHSAAFHSRYRTLHRKERPTPHYGVYDPYTGNLWSGLFCLSWHTAVCRHVLPSPLPDSTPQWHCFHSKDDPFPEGAVPPPRLLPAFCPLFLNKRCDSKLIFIRITVRYTDHIRQVAVYKFMEKLFPLHVAGLIHKLPCIY